MTLKENEGIIMDQFKKIYDAVILGDNISIEEFCIIGVPARGHKSGEMETIIGSNAYIRSHTVIYAGNKIGEGFQTGNKVNIRELNTIGNNVSIGTLSVIEHHVVIEDGVRIHSQVFVPEYSIIETGAWLGPNVVLTNAKYPLSPNAKSSLKGALIKSGAKIGANVTLLPGVVIGKNCLIGAGSVVVHDVPDGAVVVGNPAKIIKYINELPY
jgi:acetyltransferase-like isoleucine patch superfamily enzyme